jgi:16S rRNA (adenine1518-N6/adenine1519-N6)-dimethyltransferase
LTRNSRESLPCEEDLFFKVVKAAFHLRRKMLRNSLHEICKHIPEKYSDKRPEQLSVEDFIELTVLIENLEKP